MQQLNGCNEHRRYSIIKWTDTGQIACNRHWIMVQSKQCFQLIVCCVCVFDYHWIHCHKARYCSDSVWIMECVSLCLSDRIRYTSWFILYQPDWLHAVTWHLLHNTFGHASHVYLFCVGVFMSMYVHVCVCVCLYVLACAWEKVWESPFSSLLFVDCWVVCFRGNGPHDNTGRRGVMGFIVFWLRTVCIYKCNVFPCASFVHERLDVQFRVCYVDIDLGNFVKKK